ncbi:MAG: LLM class flavin-dependent oxidoreductase [Acetobacteraceae bacterium]
MILTATFGSAATAGRSLADLRSLLADTARAGIDAALFVRSPGAGAPMLDGVALIAALAAVPGSIGLGAGVPVDYQEPFHLARAFAAIDRLTRGRSAVVADLAAGDDLAAAIGHTTPVGERDARRAELLDVTTRLWDSWEDAALLVDRPAGLFTDPARIHRLNHDGAYFAVRGPLNAPRPLQGWPVIVVPVRDAAAARLAARWGDVALAATETLAAEMRTQATAAGRVVRVLLDVAPGQIDAAAMRDRHASGRCDGFNLVLAEAPARLDIDRPPVPDGTTLRTRLGLPRPLSQFAV